MNKLTQFIERLESLKKVSSPFHFEVDDPSGNSFIENPRAPYRDEQMTTIHSNTRQPMKINPKHLHLKMSKMKFLHSVRIVLIAMHHVIPT